MKTKHYFVSILVILFFGIGYFLAQNLTVPALYLTTQMILGCGSEAPKNSVLLTISKNHERYEMLDENEQVREIILSDFKKQESWVLNPHKKQALLLIAPTQAQNPPLQDLTLVEKKNVSCLGDKNCELFALTTANDEKIEVQILLSQFAGTALWKMAQQRDSATWGVLKEFLDKYAPTQPIVSLQIKSQQGCRRLMVSNAQLIKNKEEVYLIPATYTKNSHTELQKLPPEVRESILKKQKVQVLEAKPQ